MENKKGLFSGIHRDGYTWKDSMIVSILVFFMMIIAGSGIFSMRKRHKKSALRNESRGGNFLAFELERATERAKQKACFYVKTFQT